LNALQLPKLAKYAVCSGNMQNLRSAPGWTLRAQRAKHRKLRSKRLNWMPAQKRTPLKKLPKKPNVTCVTPAEKLGAIDQALKAWAQLKQITAQQARRARKETGPPREVVLEYS